MKRIICFTICAGLLLSALCGCMDGSRSEEPGFGSGLREFIHETEREEAVQTLSDAIRQAVGSPTAQATAEPQLPAKPQGTAVPQETAEPIQPVAQGDYFPDVWHAGVSFADMEYPDYRVADFEPYIERLEDIAENGGSAGELESADDAAVTELYYISTLVNIADVAYSADPNDEELAAESMRIVAVYNEASDRYWSAMQKLALSENAYLLEGLYSDWQIGWFETYSATTDQEIRLNNRESELTQEYYTLISEPEPDFMEIAELYVELVGLRNELAAAAGYDSYAEYAYENFYIRNYGPERSRAIWQMAKEDFMPLLMQYNFEVGYENSRLYYSDEIDCSPELILQSMEYALPRMSEELAQAFDYMLEYGLYDIDYSPAKMNVGFTCDLLYYNEPFIFNCANDTFYDYTSMYHEFGHFVNSFYTESDLLFGAGDFDLAELQSQGMQVLMTQFFPEIFGQENGDIIRDGEILNLVLSIIDGALYDEFQQRVYAEPGLTADRVTEIFIEVYDSYGYEEYDGFENEWIYISHNFENPFYYISYAVSAVSALELFVMAHSDYAGALETYRAAAARDREAWYFDGAIEEVGLSDVFDAATGFDIAAGLDAYFRS